MPRHVEHDREIVTPEFIARNQTVPMLNRHVVHKHSRFANRIRELIGLLQEANVLFPRLQEIVRSGRSRGTDPEFVRGRELARHINDLLGHLRAVPRVSTYLAPLNVLWTPVGSYYRPDVGQTVSDFLRQELQSDEAVRPKKTALDIEYTVTGLVLGLIDSGLLASLRLCSCGNYFLARSTLMRFCSTTCRVEFWENSEQRKEQKRRKAREYYELHKTGIVRRNKLGKTGRSK